MNNSDIILKLANNNNFKDIIKICLENNIDMEYIYNKINYKINIYYDREISELISHKYDYNKKNCNWININLNKCVFYIKNSDERFKGFNNFFKYYKDIHSFINISQDNVVEFLRVQFNDFSDELEISYNLHSYDSPAYEFIFKDKNIQSYYINSKYYTKKEFLYKQRQHKLKRILNG